MSEGSKYAHRSKVAKCPIHKLVIDYCAKELEENMFFHKGQVLKDLQLEMMSASIRWDYVAEFLSEGSDAYVEYNYSLVPVAARFFKTKASTLQSTEFGSLNRFIATGHGKKTEGYVSAVFDNGRFAAKRIENMHRTTNGSKRALENYLATVRKLEGLPEETRKQLEDMEKEQRKAAGASVNRWNDPDWLNTVDSHLNGRIS